MCNLTDSGYNASDINSTSSLLGQGPDIHHIFEPEEDFSELSLNSFMMEFGDLYPAVVECFSIILLGYAAGRTGIISSTETKGLNAFIGTFTLPALIFMSMAQLDLSTVNWYFLLAISLAKTLVFVSIVLITIAVNRPLRLDKAGLFAIFCTQSNDFALGYPIIAALYEKTHPEYKQYLYLVAPVSLIVLNPIAFTLMEISKQRDFENSEFENTHIKKSESVLKVVQQVSKGVLLNPIVLMTALGMCGNLVFSHHVPEVLGSILNSLGSAFSASALFSLGLTMVGSAATLSGAGLVVPGILITLKLLVLPVVTREIVSLLNAGVDANDTISLSNYGFLYGTFPTAPGVFVYAIQYDLAVEMIAGGMVACTFLSAPIMFVSAKMISLKNELNPSDYVPDLDTFLFNMSIIGLFATVWVLIVFVLSRKWRKVPYSVTFCLVISQAIACLGAILWSSIGVKGDDDWKLYLQFSVFSFGVLSTRIWTAILAATLVFLRCRSLCFVLRMKHYMWMIGWGVPLLLIAMLLLIVKGESLKEKLDPNFQYGETQALVAVLVLVICFIVTIGCLVMQQRYERRYAQLQAMQSQPSQGGSTITILNNDEETIGVETNPTPCCSKMCEKVSPNNRCRTQNQKPETTALNIPINSNEVPKPPCSSLNCRTCFLNGGCGVVGSVSNHEKYNVTTVVKSANGACPKIRISEIEDMVLTDLQDDNDEDDDDVTRTLFSYNDDLCSPSKHPCDAAQRRRCSALLEKYRRMNQLTEPEEIGIVRDRDDEYQMLRHVILLLVLISSMFVGIALCVWTLILEDISGVYVELAFLDAALNFGQGFFTFMLFGLNTKTIVMPLHKWWRRLAYGEGSVFLPKWEDIPGETKQICEQFLSYHIDKCIHDIVRDRRWRMESYSKVFCGHELVDWLLLIGLAKDRNDAVKYGRHLLIGRVIRHIKNLHHFHDQPFFYTFCPLDIE